eukprot:gene71-668_t
MSTDLFATNTAIEWTSLSIFSFAIVIVNMIEIILISRQKRSKTSYEMLLLGLSAADLLVGLSEIGLATMYFLAEYNICNCSFDSSAIVLWYSISASLCHIWLITVDRVFAVVWPFKHRIWVTKRRVVICIIFAWFICLIVVPLCLLMKAGSTLTETVLGYVAFDVVGIMLVSYTLLVYKVFGHQRRNIMASTSQGLAAQRERSLLIMCVTIAASFCALTVPFASTAVTHRPVKFAMKAALIFNSLTNPLIYFFWKYTERRMKITRTKQHNSSNIVLPSTSSAKKERPETQEIEM